ncbi:Small nuclear ribonucleoprotein family protein [Forsythia ovata]|uniref:Small nuclear ribonucleoprotein family protein n=1 Tax=Forsythia ovata TaxID=205694 RepID=A0ABD1U529_9LAMI
MSGKHVLGSRCHRRLHDTLLSDCEEFRKLPLTKGSKEDWEDCRTLSLVLFFGKEVISLTVGGLPPSNESRVKVIGANAVLRPGTSCAASHGVPIGFVQAQPGLAGPIRGVGGPAPGMMHPQISRFSISYPQKPSQGLRTLTVHESNYHPGTEKKRKQLSMWVY